MPLIGILFAFVAGFADTVGFVALFGLFTAHVTGNFVLIGASVAKGHAGLIGKLLALPMFVFGVAATRSYLLWIERRQRDATMPVVAIELLLLTAFMLTGVWASPLVGADDWRTVAVGMIGVATMAVQNAASRLTFAKLGPTTVMTGNVTQLVIDAIDLVAKAAALETRDRMRKMWPPVLAFAVGAVGAGLSYRLAGFWALGAPIAALALIVVRARGRRQESS